MKTTRRTRCGLEQAKAKEDRAWERTMTKKAEAWEKSWGVKNQPRRNP
jgi:hypothetical protein